MARRTRSASFPVDSMFSPINRVAYDVEAARVGQRTDYDKLILDVTTNGSIDPKDAIAQGAEILIRQLAIFTDLEKIEGYGESAAPSSDGAGEAAGVSLAGGMENFPIEELELGVRSYNCLKRVGIETIGDLVTKSESELAAIPNFGKKSIEEVKETLQQHGLNLRGGGNGARSNSASRALRKEARPRLGAPQGALLEPCRCADRARPHQDDRHQGEGSQADRRADDHARPSRRPACAPPGDGFPALARRRAQAVRGRRSALQGSPGRLHADREDRPAAGRRGGDGVSRARQRGVRRRPARGADARAGVPLRSRRPSTRPKRPPRSRRPRPRRRRTPRPRASPRSNQPTKPTRAPTTAMAAPPTTRFASDFAKLVSKNRHRITASPTSSKPTTIAAVTIAAW